MLDGVDTFLRRYPDSPVVLDVLGTLDADAIRARARLTVPDAEEIATTPTAAAPVGRRWRSSNTLLSLEFSPGS